MSVTYKDGQAVVTCACGERTSFDGKGPWVGPECGHWVLGCESSYLVTIDPQVEFSNAVIGEVLAEEETE